MEIKILKKHLLTVHQSLQARKVQVIMIEINSRIPIQKMESIDHLLQSHMVMDAGKTMANQLIPTRLLKKELMIKCRPQ
jgi:hypothetical protein